MNFATSPHLIEWPCRMRTRIDATESQSCDLSRGGVLRSPEFQPLWTCGYCAAKIGVANPAKIGVHRQNYGFMLAFGFPVQSYVDNVSRVDCDNIAVCERSCVGHIIRKAANGVRPAKTRIAERSIFRGAGPTRCPNRPASKPEASFRLSGLMPATSAPQCR